MSKIYFTTPKGTAGYPWLFRGDTKFSDKPTFKTDIICTIEEGKAFLAKLKEQVEEEIGPKKEKAAQYPVKFTDSDCTITVKSGYAPDVIDAAGAPLTEDCNLGSGSVIKARGSSRIVEVTGKTYVTLDLGAVRVYELVTYNSGGGWDDDEDTAQADEQKPSTKQSMPNEDGTFNDEPF